MIGIERVPRIMTTVTIEAEGTDGRTIADMAANTLKYIINLYMNTLRLKLRAGRAEPWQIDSQQAEMQYISGAYTGLRKGRFEKLLKYGPCICT